MTDEYRAEVTRIKIGKVLRFRVLRADKPLRFADVIELWIDSHTFRNFFISILADAPFPSYFLETPPVTSETIDREFEFVLVDSQQLAGVSTDRPAFSSHFESAPNGTFVIEFSNLGGDASLVVPCPGEPLSAYSQISSFARQAPEAQQHALWKLVGTALRRRLGAQPVWLSTSGLGIYWLHIRLDARPKYYTHAPYRNM
jgi:hypothetical protein